MEGRLDTSCGERSKEFVSVFCPCFSAISIKQSMFWGFGPLILTEKLLQRSVCVDLHFYENRSVGHEVRNVNSPDLQDYICSLGPKSKPSEHLSNRPSLCSSDVQR